MAILQADAHARVHPATGSGASPRAAERMGEMGGDALPAPVGGLEIWDGCHFVGGLRPACPDPWWMQTAD